MTLTPTAYRYRLAEIIDAHDRAVQHFLRARADHPTIDEMFELQDHVLRQVLDANRSVIHLIEEMNTSPDVDPPRFWNGWWTATMIAGGVTIVGLLGRRRRKV